MFFGPNAQALDRIAILLKGWSRANRAPSPPRRDNGCHAPRGAFRERTMRELVAQYLSHSISRRGFVGGLTKAGLTAAAAQSVLTAVASVSYAQGAGPQPSPTPAAPAAAVPATPAAPAAAAVAGVKPFQGTGGATFAEQLIA